MFNSHRDAIVFCWNQTYSSLVFWEEECCPGDGFFFFLENCQMCLNMCVSSFYCTRLDTGKTLLRKVTLERIRVFKSMAFPLKDRCPLESCCVCFSIFCKQLIQLNVLIVFRLSVKNTPSILIISFICMFLIFLT